jgi:hypothetical protein
MPGCRHAGTAFMNDSGSYPNILRALRYSL